MFFFYNQSRGGAHKYCDIDVRGPWKGEELVAHPTLPILWQPNIFSLTSTVPFIIVAEKITGLTLSEVVVVSGYRPIHRIQLFHDATELGRP
jgi:hypothetical protein